MTLYIVFGIVPIVATISKTYERKMKCDMRKCRNWQTSKTKDLVSIALVWVQVPSSAFIIRRELSFIWKFFFVSISIIPNISLYTKKSIKKEKN